MKTLIVRIVGGFVTFVVVGYMVFGGVALCGWIDPVINDPLARMVADLVLAAIVVGAVLLYAQKFGGVPLRAISLDFSWRHALGAAGIFAATLGLAAGYMTVLGQSGAHPLTIVMPSLGVLVIGFLGELGVIHEEITSRGFFLTLLQKRYGVGLAIFFSAILFMMSHIPFKGVNNISISNFLAGIAFGYLYVKSGSIWTGLVVHVAHNFATDLFITGSNNGVSVGIGIFQFAGKLSFTERLGFDLLLTGLTLGLTYLFFGLGTRVLEPSSRLIRRWTTVDLPRGAAHPVFKPGQEALAK